jgi:hypothetical protein
MAITPTGLRGVQRNLHSAISGISGRTMRGVVKAAVELQRESMQQVPVDFGTLKNSCVVTSEMINGNPVAAVAYQTEYAPYVHENMEAAHPVGNAKFLERPAMENAQRLVEIIREDARI